MPHASKGVGARVTFRFRLTRALEEGFKSHSVREACYPQVLKEGVDLIISLNLLQGIQVKALFDLGSICSELGPE
jgi:hypothetical protein